MNGTPIFRRVALIGFGLIGGSIARAARAQGLTSEIVTTARSEKTRARVLELGIVDRVDKCPFDPEVFNGVVTKYRQWLTSNGLAPEASKARYEFFYNLFQPFVRAIAIYLVAFLLVCASWVKRSTALYRSAAMLTALAWVLHTAGLSFDMMLEGRPPVTNVYASVIFAGWGVVLLAATVEWYWRNGVSMVTAPLAGLIALIVAHSLAPGGAVGVMRAALDMSFWLAAVAMVIALHLGRDAGTRPEPSETESARGSAGKASRWRLGILRHRAPSF